MEVKFKKYIIPGCLGLTLLGNCSCANIELFADEIINKKINSVIEELSQEKLSSLDFEVIFSDDSKNFLYCKGERSTAYIEPLVVNILSVDSSKF